MFIPKLGICRVLANILECLVTYTSPFAVHLLDFCKKAPSSIIEIYEPLMGTGLTLMDKMVAI